MITRRGMFGLLPALGALAVPHVEAESNVRPIILEHVCDWGRNRYTVAEIEEMEAWYLEHVGSPRYWGCGTRFQFHFGVNPYCPKCGYAYETTLDIIKRGIYRVVQGRIPE